MDTSIFVAQIFAVFYIVVGLGMLISGKYYKKAFKDMMNHSGTVFTLALMALIAGFVIIKVHNVWDTSWEVLVTIIGWAAFIKGVFFFVFPIGMSNFGKHMLKKKNFMNIWGLLVLIIGLVFGYFGFVM